MGSGIGFIRLRKLVNTMWLLALKVLGVVFLIVVVIVLMLFALLCVFLKAVDEEYETCRHYCDY